MDPKARATIAANLKALMEKRPNLNTFAKITAAGGPTNGTLDRMRRAESGCSIDQLDLLGRVFELEAWQLLVPNLQPNNAPVLLGAGGEAERALWARIDTLSSQVNELREAGQTGPGALDETPRGVFIEDKVTAKKTAKRGAR